MFENYYFVLGIINNLLLISIFLIVKFSIPSKLKGVGIAYLALIISAIFGIVIAQQQNKPIQYSIFLGIFIAFLLLEGIYEFLLKLSFRSNWKLLTPYLMLYWATNYGFIVMSWKNSVVQGRIMLGLFTIQLFANIISHTKKSSG
jgi:uncharacterized membrane protein